MPLHYTPIRNAIISHSYKYLCKPIFFRFDPEHVHDRMTHNGIFLGSHSITKFVTAKLFDYKHQMLRQKFHGVQFDNPIGLAAGFDKDAQLMDILPSVGFGFAEVGSITGEPCEGNPKPRVWRLPKSKSLLIYYGLKNEGSDAISERLKNQKFKIPIGISIAKTNNASTVDTEAGIDDYAKAYKAFASVGDYTTINISCPNAFGGEPFTDPIKLESLLSRIDEIESSKPVLLKLSPDLSFEQIDKLIDVAERYKIDGYISANLTKKRDLNTILDKVPFDKGGLSGKVQEDLATNLIKHLYRRTKGKKIIIGCGGVFSAEDAYKKIKAGASLIQLITGMIYEGPQVISQINYGLVQLLKQDGYNHISEAIGADNKYTE